MSDTLVAKKKESMLTISAGIVKRQNIGPTNAKSSSPWVPTTASKLSKKIMAVIAA
jgi:hypothetical protein